jgi:hypothetical protein
VVVVVVVAAAAGRVLGRHTFGDDAILIAFISAYCGHAF